MTKESYNFGVDTEAKRLYTETSGMTAKRFILSDFFWEVLDTKYDWLGNTEPFSEEVIEEEDYLLIGRARTQDDGEDICKLLNKLVEENKQLKKDNEWLFKCVENQSALINMLDSRIMEYNMEHKITIKLTKKDLKTLDKALSYYTHQKVEE